MPAGADMGSRRNMSSVQGKVHATENCAARMRPLLGKQRVSMSPASAGFLGAQQDTWGNVRERAMFREAARSVGLRAK